MEPSKNHLDAVQHVELLNPEEVNINNVKRVTISAVKSPPRPPYDHHFAPGQTNTTPSPQYHVDKVVKSLVEGFPSAPKKVVENEKARGIVSPAWDGDFRTFIQNVIPCPMCSFPVRGSGCGCCH